MIWQTIQKPNAYGNGLPSLEPPQEVGVYFDEERVKRISRNSWMVPAVCTTLLLLVAAGLWLWSWWDPRHTAGQEASPPPILTADERLEQSRLIWQQAWKDVKDGSQKP